jgi:hypothetical protein
MIIEDWLSLICVASKLPRHRFQQIHHLDDVILPEAYFFSKHKGAVA